MAPRPAAWLLAVLTALVAVAAPAQDCVDYDDAFPDPVPTAWRLHGGGDVQAVAARDDLLVLASDACLQVFDLADPDAPVLLAIADVIARRIDLQDDRLYVLEVESVAVVGLADPAAPQVLGRAALPERGFDLQARGDVLFVTTEDPTGLAAFDVSDPAAPQRLGFAASVAGLHFAVDDRRAYLIAPTLWDPYGTLQYIDVSDPAAMVTRDYFFFDGYPRGVALLDQVLYVPTGFGLRVIDVSDPSQLVFLPGDGLTGPDNRIVVAPPYAYALDIESTTEGQLLALSVIDPAAPQLIGAVGHEGMVADLALAGDRLVLATGEPAPVMADVSVPAAPAMSPWQGDTGLEPFSVFDVDSRGDHLYVSRNLGDPLVIYDASDASGPVEVSRVTGTESGRGVAVHDTLLYSLVDPDDPELGHRLDVYSIADPAQAVFLGDVDLPALSRPCAGPGAVYFASNALIHAVDTSDPTLPAYVGSLNPPGSGLAQDMTVAAGVAYVAMGQLGLLTYDVSQPTVLDPLGSLTLDGYVLDVSVEDDLAVILLAPDRLHTVDVSDPATPAVVAEVATSPGASEIALHDGIAYVAAELGLFDVFDVSDPQAPVQVGRSRYESGALGLELAGPWVLSVQLKPGLEAGWRACPPVLSAPEILPAANVTLDAFPNPFNPAVTFRFDLPAAQRIRLVLHDLAGRRIVDLVAGTYPAGEHRARWLGVDREERPLPSGTYVLRLETESGVVTRKVSLVR